MLNLLKIRWDEPLTGWETKTSFGPNTKIRPVNFSTEVRNTLSNLQLYFKEMEPGENVKLVFKNALHHYNRILQQLKDEKEFELSDPIFEGDVLNNISKNSEIINKLDSTGGLDAVGHNRKFLCDCLRGYILHLEKIKDEISSKFQNTYSLPIMDLNKVDNELELANRILVNSFKDQIG